MGLETVRRTRSCHQRWGGVAVWRSAASLWSPLSGRTTLCTSSLQPTIIAAWTTSSWRRLVDKHVPDHTHRIHPWWVLYFKTICASRSLTWILKTVRRTLWWMSSSRKHWRSSGSTSSTRTPLLWLWVLVDLLPVFILSCLIFRYLYCFVQSVNTPITKLSRRTSLFFALPSPPDGWWEEHPL